MIHCFDFPWTASFAADLAAGGGKGTKGFAELLGELYDAEPLLTTSGIDAIRLFLRAKGFKPGARILITPYICYHVIGGLLQDGYDLCFVDIDRDYKVSLPDLAAKLTRTSAAVIVPHMFGILNDVASIREMASPYGAAVMEDSAQSFGGTRHGCGPTMEGECAILSFGLTKPITAMGGGALLLRDPDLAAAAKAQLVAAPALRPAVVKFLKFIFYTNRDLFYHVAEGMLAAPEAHSAGADASPRAFAGTTDGPMTTSFNRVQGAIGFAHGRRIDRYNEKRRENAAYLVRALEGQGFVFSPEVEKWPLLRLPARFEGASREETTKIVSTFRENGILIDRPYPYIPDVLSTQASCPGAEELAHATIGLPIHPALHRSDLDKIVECAAVSARLVRRTPGVKRVSR